MSAALQSYDALLVRETQRSIVSRQETPPLDFLPLKSRTSSEWPLALTLQWKRPEGAYTAQRNGFPDDRSESVA
jgi:hypothetical protein